MSDQAPLEVRVDAAGGDAEDLAALTDRLRRQLLQLDVDGVEQVASGEPPPGAKAIDVLVIGALLVRLGRGAGKLASVVRTVQAWVGTQPMRTVKLELDGDAIEVSGASSHEQQQLIELWIARHAEAS